jgi:Zn-dependent M16 (insulinase) family peptidase
MKSSTVALALRLDVIPESLLVYAPFLPSAVNQVGVIIDGEPVPYEDMRVRLRNEVLDLRAEFDHGYQMQRAELMLTGEASRTDELPAVLEWMNHSLYAPYLDVDNLPRIQDVLDQILSHSRNRMKRSEEAWVNNPANAYRFQTNPLMMSTASFLTKTHHFQRLRWRLTDPGDSTSREEIAMLFDVLGEFGADMDREKLTSILTNLEQSDKVVPDSLKETLPPPAQTLSETAKKVVARVARELKATLADIPDANLSEDWVYLCAETRADLLVEPEQALDELEYVLDLVRNAGNARMYMVSNSSDRKTIMPEIHDLVARLEADTQPLRQQYAEDERIDRMLQTRQPEVFDPVYVGLVHEGTRNGVMVFGCQHARPYDTTEQAVVDCLTGKLFGGGGPHGIFMNTWAAGLAYSNGYGYSQSTGRLSYYAERCPDVAQTMKFVVDLLKNAEDDTSLVDYAVAQIFNATRASSRYEDRGKAMAADLTDGRTPRRVRAFRQEVLDLARSDRAVYSILDDRMEEAYGPVLIGYGPRLSQSEDGVFFLIGPEPQFESLEQYIETAEGTAQPVYRLYPRDFWLRAPVEVKS